MNKLLTKEFLEQDCDIGIQHMLIKTIEEYSGQDVVRDFIFNRFNIILNFQAEHVMIQDNLNTGEDGECIISLSVFQKILYDKIE